MRLRKRAEKQSLSRNAGQARRQWACAGLGIAACHAPLCHPQQLHGWRSIPRPASHRAHHVLEDEEELVVLTDHLLELHDARVVQLAQAAHLRQRKQQGGSRGT